MKSISISQLLLALAIAYLAYAILSFTREVPAIITLVDDLSPQVETITKEVALVREEISQVRQLVAKQTPEILTQVQDTLPVIEQVVAESERYSSQIPQILRQLEQIEQQVANVQAQLPQIYQIVDDVVLTTQATTAEIAKWRPHSQKYIDELEYARQDIPQYLTRVEHIVADAKTVGKETSSGLVSGFFKGVISLPFEVVSGLTGIVDSKSKSAKYLTATDVTLIQEHAIALLESQAQTQTIWQNVETGNRGRISKGNLQYRDKQPCHELTFINHFKGQKETLKELMCKNDKGLWQVI